MLLALSELVDGVKVPLHVMLSGLLIVASVPLLTVMSAELEKEATASENTNVTVALSPTLRAVSENVKEFTEGDIVSMVKALTERLSLTLLKLSVTFIVQLL